MAAYDRASELKAFDDTKTGVKGLVDAGVTKIPRLFIHPHLHTEPTTTNRSISIPIINLSSPRRSDVVQQLLEAAESYGIFQAVDHGIPAEVLDEMLQGVRRFHEQDSEIKKGFYTRDSTRKANFNSNFDLYQSPVANWRDTFFCEMEPGPPTPEEFPFSCRSLLFALFFMFRFLFLENQSTKFRPFLASCQILCCEDTL